MRAKIRAALALMLLTLGAAAPARAQVDQQQTINHALGAIERLKSDQRWKTSFDPELAKARAVLVVPDLYKAGFVLGGQFGNGVLLVRGKDGNFSYPAFYTLSGGSVGLQIGAEDVSVAFLIMTDKGLEAVMQDKFKIGGEMQVALAVVGGGEGVSSGSNMAADIRAYAYGAIGLYGSLSLEGAVISPRDSWNEAYYGKRLAARDIVFNGIATNPEADKLRDFLAH